MIIKKLKYKIVNISNILTIYTETFMSTTGGKYKKNATNIRVDSIRGKNIIEPKRKNQVDVIDSIDSINLINETHITKPEIPNYTDRIQIISFPMENNTKLEFVYNNIKFDMDKYTRRISSNAEDFYG